MPVTLAYFQARHDGNNVVLSWSTLSEINNDYFKVERSADLTNWITINKINGAGDNRNLIENHLVDTKHLQLAS